MAPTLKFFLRSLPLVGIELVLVTFPNTKNGSQQMMKAPVTMARVLAAFLSLLASSETCFFFFF